MPESQEKSNNKFWKGLKDYYNDPEILKAKVNEFNDGVTDDFDTDQLSGISRRKFLALLTASAAFTATACTDYRDKGEIIPYTKRPEEILPGKANYYASTCKGCSLECGVLIKTREGRPIKIDGNPEHPINKGKICSIGQASILNLYDPERLTVPTKNKSEVSWKTADKEIIALLKNATSKNKKIAVISNKINSPTSLKVLEKFKEKYPTSKFYFYELFSDNTKRDAWEKCYGTRNIPSINIDKADILVSLDSDFLSREGNFIENTRQYASRKDIMKSSNFSKLFSVEGGMSLTGMNADVRIKLKPEFQHEFVLSILSEIALVHGLNSKYLNSKILNLLKKYSLNNFISAHNLDKKKVHSLVESLIKNQKKAIVITGDSLSEETHIAVNLLNEVLNNSSLYNQQSAHVELTKESSMDDLKSLIDEMKNGMVDILINLDANPVYHFPSDLKFADVIKKVGSVISLSESPSETTALSNYVLPINHALESWGDSQVRSSVYTLQQPVIAPLFKTREKEAVLLNWLSGDTEKFTHDIYHKFLMNSFKNEIYSRQNTDVAFKTFWYSAIHDGFVELDKRNTSPLTFDSQSTENLAAPKIKTGITLHLQPSYFIGDGRHANNGWLQELPHPVTKVTWDNCAMISQKTAEKIGVTFNDMISIETNSVKMELPIMMQPGLTDDLIVVELGYGRKNSGEVADDVGFNVNRFLHTKSIVSPFVFTNVSVVKTGKTYKLMSTQEHNFIENPDLRDFQEERKIIFEGTLDQYKKDPKFLLPEEKVLHGITREHEYKGLKWGMAIDLNKCTSCSICVASCNVENNIPVVGKDQVEVGREMQWMRLDRYYSGEPENPKVSTQPMLCQQCDNAPCENVCPVNATNHSPDGLNQMVYNRCVGTRYCSNNCPYKVRRFNFFNFRDHFADAYYENDVTALANNPEVTVRSRGVMEKCTFCIQRIMEAKEDAIREGRELKGDDVKTACQVACPADAIVFGDINDPESEVSKYREHDVGYLVLKELYVKPNITYIAKLRNTDTEEV